MHEGFVVCHTCDFKHKESNQCYTNTSGTRTKKIKFIATEFNEWTRFCQRVLYIHYIYFFFPSCINFEVLIFFSSHGINHRINVVMSSKMGFSRSLCLTLQCKILRGPITISLVVQMLQCGPSRQAMCT